MSKSWFYIIHSDGRICLIPSIVYDRFSSSVEFQWLAFGFALNWGQY